VGLRVHSAEGEQRTLGRGDLFAKVGCQGVAGIFPNTLHNQIKLVTVNWLTTA